MLSWGSTYGVVKTAVKLALKEGLSVSHVHLRYINPLPKNLGEILGNFDKIIIPEMNNGQLVKIIRSEFLVPAEGYNKVKGLPFATEELTAKIKETLGVTQEA
jgi:2-oxoglutarate ferredoxin oxidoreductase subunit alpha